MGKCLEQDSPAPRVKSERYSPHPAGSIETQLFHVGIPGPVQGIGARPTETRSHRFEKRGVREQLVLHVLRQRIELRLELAVKLDRPGHICLASYMPSI